MAKVHVITKDIGNLRGLSTSSPYIRTPNIASVADNIKRNSDGTLGPRRGYQCAAAKLGGMGTGNYDNPVTNTIETITLDDDGNLYKLNVKKIYIYYDGRVDGVVSGATQAANCEITAAAHNLATGTKVVLRNIPGMTQLNGNTYTITSTGVNTYTIGVNSTGYTAYGIGTGEWAIEFTQYRSLLFSIFTDSRVVNTTAESITCQITARRSARVNATQTSVNTINVDLGHEFAATDTAVFTDSSGVAQSRTVSSVTTSSITIAGTAVTVTDQTYIDQFFDIPFGKGFDTATPYLISTFLSIITNATTGIRGLTVSANGDTNVSAAFIEIIEETIINDNSVYTIDYNYWKAVNKVTTVTFPGSANATFQNSDDFEVASFATFDDVLYIANGWDYPQKYDGQTAYRVGMPDGIRPTTADGAAGQLDNGNYTYAITYEQRDTLSHIVEGPISEGITHVIKSGPKNITVTATSLAAASGWNTDGALAGAAATTVYGADSNDYQYHLISVQNSPHTMKIGDTAFYLDRIIAKSSSGIGGNTMAVSAGHGAEVNDVISFINTIGHTVQRVVTKVTATSITFDGPSTSLWAINTNVSANKANVVFGNIAIVNGAQTDTNALTVDVSHTIQLNDVVTFTDSSSRVQRRTVTNSAATIVTIDGPPVSVIDNLLIKSATIRTTQFYVRRPLANTTGASLTNGDPISNNLRINIWRTIQNGDLYYLLTSLPNNSITGTTQTFSDTIKAGSQKGSIIGATAANPCSINAVSHGLITNDQIIIRNVAGMVELNERTYLVVLVDADNFTLKDIDGIAINSAGYTAYSSGGTWEIFFGDSNELSFPYETPLYPPQSPPISKYVFTYGNQLLYAGGERNNPENSDNVFFSDANLQGSLPEAVPAATNFFALPSQNDDISGIGQAGTTLIIFKKKSTYAIVGDILTVQFQVTALAPGLNIGCVAHATIQSVGSLLYFLSTNGVYAITEAQFYPTDPFGKPVPISTPIDDIFDSQKYLPQEKLVYKRSIAINYTKDDQYLLFIPAEESTTDQRTANSNSILLCYDYHEANWFVWKNINAAGGMFSINDDLYFHERRKSSLEGNTANLYKQHRFYRLIDYADHTSNLTSEWRSSWQDVGVPEVRKKFNRCMLLIDRESALYQFNAPQLEFSTYLDRLPDVPHTIANITTVDNKRNAAWNSTPWSVNSWSGYTDSFARVNLRQGTVAKSIQIGFKLTAINTTFKLAGMQLEAIPEFRKTIVR